MKLAEALILRADRQKKVEQIKQRLIRNAKVQEGERPTEDPDELIAELDDILDELTGLIKKINKTNSATQFQEGMTLSDALAERDTLMLKRKALDELVQASSIVMSRFSRSEVKYFSTIRTAEVQKQVDALSRQYRDLDAKIQALNWQIDLIEQ